jgi:hypothetical protein
MRPDPVDDEREHEKDQATLEVAVLPAARESRGLGGGCQTNLCWPRGVVVVAQAFAVAFFFGSFFGGGVTSVTSTLPPAASIAALAPAVAPMP